MVRDKTIKADYCDHCSNTGWRMATWTNVLTTKNGDTLKLENQIKVKGPCQYCNPKGEKDDG